MHPCNKMKLKRARNMKQAAVTIAAIFAFCLAMCPCDAFHHRHSRIFPETKNTVSARRNSPCEFLHAFDKSPRKSTLLFSSSDLDETTKIADSNVPSILLFVGIPTLSLILPVLLQLKLIGPLIVFKRIYIYTLAALVLVTASIRGSSDSSSLGTRLIDLTREVLPYDDNSLESMQIDTRFQEMEILDEVDDSTQAVGLPLLVVSSLVASLFFVLVQNSDAPSSPITSIGIPIQSIIQPLITLSNAVVISLFARAELRRLFPEQNANVATIGALTLSGLAFLGPSAYVWPIQNILCACLAISVARAIQIQKFTPLVLALFGLVAYDVISVGLQLVNLGAATLAAEQQQQAQMVAASASASSSPSAAANSIMGAVALAKTEGTWQPGLFQVRLRGMTTDLLGLGDAVFPTLLSTFALRFDRERESYCSIYFLASCVGFAIGCIVCELVPGISDTGLPALLFLVPSMLTSMLILAVIRGELQSLLSFKTDELAP